MFEKAGAILRIYCTSAHPGQNRTHHHVLEHHHHPLPTELPPNAGRAAAGIAIVLVAQLMIVLDATVVNVALPRIDGDLGFGPASLSWVLNAYTLAFGGLRCSSAAASATSSAASSPEIGWRSSPWLRLGLAQTPGQLVAARTFQGVGAALAAPERPGPAHHERTRQGGATARWRSSVPSPPAARRSA